ncbi:MAG: hypothetical protein GWO04_23275 [Actinobacteria bacterium]|nr:hypothetical protein [Actinomycetota bacterium]NIV56565.1 hypothetical protein [Actinomycetota bacterium]
MDDNLLSAVIAEPSRHLDHEDAAIRRLAVSSISHGADHLHELQRLLAEDADVRVRAEAAEALGRRGLPALRSLMTATADPDPIVVEAVATALGEIGDRSAIDWLVEAAQEHSDRLVREAAVAALGAIGDERAVPALLSLVAKAPPQVRRRSVVALTVFDGPEVEAAIRQALSDRNPMVREAAEMVAGRPID